MADEGTTRKKKKRKKKRYLLKLLLLILLGVGVYQFLTSDFFAIDTITVEENAYFTTEQIIGMAQVTTGENLFRVSTKKVRQRLMEEPYILQARTKRVLPGELVIQVAERKEAAAVLLGTGSSSVQAPPQAPPVVSTDEAVSGEMGAAEGPGADGIGTTDAAISGAAITSGETSTVIQTGEGPYAIIDEDGLVLRITEAEPVLTLLQGLTVDVPQPGTPLRAEENAALADTLNLLKEVKKQDLYFKKILISSIILRVYIYDHLMCEGTPENLTNNLSELKEVLVNLDAEGIQRGMLKVGGDGYISWMAVTE